MSFQILKVIADWAIGEAEKDSNNAAFRSALLRLADAICDVLKFC